jgi:enterochelin esterase-like enzyme
MLLSGWLLALLVVLAAGMHGTGLACGVRRRRRLRSGLPVATGWRAAVRRLGITFGAVVLTVAAVAAAVNDHYSYIPSFHALWGDVSPDLAHGPVRHTVVLSAGTQRMPDHGTVEKVSVAGPASGVAARETYVYLPPQYFDPRRPDQRFPVLYLLHGSPGISVDWIRGGWADRVMDSLLAAHRIQPFIIVFPDLNGGYRRDTECEDIVGGAQVQTYVVRDVVAYTDAQYRTIPDRTGRVIGGLSTGGYCALNLTLRHQDVFSGIVSHSGYDRPEQNIYTGNLFRGDRELERANSPFLYLPDIPLVSPLGVYLDVGAGDRQSRLETLNTYEVFTRRHVPVALHDFAGETHSWLAWRRNLLSSLPWVSAWFASDGAGEPDPAAAGRLASSAPGQAPMEAAPPDVQVGDQQPSTARLVQTAPQSPMIHPPATPSRRPAGPPPRR